MVGTIIQRYDAVNHGIARQYTACHRALNTGVNSWDILLGDRAADYSVAELVALAAFVGLQTDLYMTVLTLTTALACKK